MLRRLLIGLVALFIVVGTVQIVAAQDEGEPLIPLDVENDRSIDRFDDGRLNAFDLDAPVAIFYSYQRVPKFTGGPNDQVLNGIEVWAFDPKTDTSQQVIFAPIADIRLDTQDRANDPYVVRNGAIQLHRTTDGTFVVSAPGENGLPYTFEWADPIH